MTRIAVVGGGKIGEALVAGLIDSGRAIKDLVVAEQDAERAKELAARYGIRATAAVADAAASFAVFVTPCADAAAASAEDAAAAALAAASSLLPLALLREIFVFSQVLDILCRSGTLRASLHRPWDERVQLGGLDPASHTGFQLLHGRIVTALSLVSKASLKACT